MNIEFKKSAVVGSMLICFSSLPQAYTSTCSQTCNGKTKQTCTTVGPLGKELQGKQGDTLLDQPVTTWKEYNKASTTTTNYRWFGSSFYCPKKGPACTQSWSLGYTATYSAGVGASYTATSPGAQISLNGMYSYSYSKSDGQTFGWTHNPNTGSAPAKYIKRVQVTRDYTSGYIWDKQVTNCTQFGCKRLDYWCPSTEKLATATYRRPDTEVIGTYVWWAGSGGNPNKLSD